MTIAEESTAWPDVSRSTSEGGLGFGFKWNIGWMHDMLEYLDLDSGYRRYRHDNLAFGMLYAFREHYMLAFSHDEAVHMEASMPEKMAGDDWQKFANLRPLYAFMCSHAGKKLLFMGSELAQRDEGDHEGSILWYLQDSLPHGGVQRLVGDLNRLYRERAALHAADCDSRRFQWVDCTDQESGVVSFLRGDAEGRSIPLVVCHFTPAVRAACSLGVPRPESWREALNSDSRH